MNWKEWIGKKVFVQLKSKAIYSGVIKEVEDVGDGHIFISMIDKFEKPVIFVVNEIIKITEEN